VEKIDRYYLAIQIDTPPLPTRLSILSNMTTPIPNDDFTISFRISGQTLSNLFGKTLSPAQRWVFTNPDSQQYFTGEARFAKILATMLESLIDQAEDETDSDDPDYDDSINYIKDKGIEDADHYKLSDDWTPGQENPAILELRDDIPAVEDLLCGRPDDLGIKHRAWDDSIPQSVKTEVHKQVLQKEEEHAKGKDWFNESRKWNEFGLQEVRDLVDSLDMEGHTYRTLEAYPEKFQHLIKPRLHKEHERLFVLPPNLSHDDFECVSFNDLRGEFQQVYALKRRWVVDDSSVLGGIMADFFIAPGKRCLGRGSGFRNQLEAFHKACEVMLPPKNSVLYMLPPELSSKVCGMAGLATGHIVECKTETKETD